MLIKQLEEEPGGLKVVHDGQVSACVVGGGGWRGGGEGG